MPEIQQVFDFDAPARARRTDPSTSKDAAASVNVTEMEAVVLRALAAHPMTTHEIAAHTGVSLVTISPRIRPLVQKRLVREHQIEGKTVKRAGESGRMSIVWEKVNGSTKPV